MASDELIDLLREFLSEYPEATLADVMAEFDLSDTEAQAALAEIRRMIDAGVMNDDYGEDGSIVTGSIDATSLMRQVGFARLAHALDGDSDGTAQRLTIERLSVAVNAALREKENRVIVLGFGLDGSYPHNLADTASTMEPPITRERVRQIRYRAMVKLREFIGIGDLRKAIVDE